ncbi:MAG: hypothetical protein ACLFVP_04320 [Candidatus Bathyarchaeia archaeon]
MSDRCSICGRPGADILCGRCGRIVCDRCFDEEEEVCISCANGSLMNLLSIEGDLLIPGVILIMVGLIITSLALLSDAVKGEGIIIVFPFVINGSNSGMAVLMTIIFISVLLLSTILPYYIAIHRGGSYRGNEGYYSFYEGMTDRTAERMEYMITTVIPKRLRDKIYIEEGEGEIYIKTRGDERYDKSYLLPEGFGVESLDYDYEGEYLLIKLRLVRPPGF